MKKEIGPSFELSKFKWIRSQSTENINGMNIRKIKKTRN
jgi:hypothetical protein